MHLVQKNYVRAGKRDYKALKILSKLSKNLYIITLCTLLGSVMSLVTIFYYSSVYHLVKDNENYQLLPSQVAQQTLKIVDRTFKSFLCLLRERKKRNYKKSIGMPRYLSKNGHFICVFTKDMIKIEDDKVRLSMGWNFTKKYDVRYLLIWV